MSEQYVFVKVDRNTIIKRIKDLYFFDTRQEALEYLETLADQLQDVMGITLKFTQNKKRTRGKRR